MLTTVGWPHPGEGMHRGWRALGISAKLGHRRPVQQNRRNGRVELTELFRPVDRFSADYRQHRLEVLNFLILDAEIVGRKDRQVRQLSWNDRALAALFC